MVPVPTPFADILTGQGSLLLLFYMMVGIYVIFTMILFYHWRTYSNDARINLMTFVVYFVLTMPLILVLATAVAI
tara:strand:- start:158 stop:382 length:225 start_codon:yes stop_codon:yes gene_type:complete